jgi:3-mercaptopyruvate sulfurtransferase SseA
MVENRKNPLPWILIVGGVLLLIMAGLAWVMLHQPVIPVTTSTPASVSQVQRVSLVDAKAAFDAKKAVFLDVRDSSSYVEGHIPGALSIPLSDLPNRKGELDPKLWIIPYCT